MKLHRIGIILIACLVALLAASACLAETMLVPCAVEGAQTLTQYRYREQTRMETDTLNVVSGWILLDELYGEWGEWSGWSTTAATATDTLDVESKDVAAVTRTAYTYTRWYYYSTIDKQYCYTYHGNYAYFLEKRAQRLEVARAEVARATNLYRTELDWMRRMPQARGHKAKYREEAFYELEKQAHRRLEEQQVRLQMKSAYIGSKIFEAEYVSKAYGDLVLLKDFYYNFSRYEKLGIVGNNGTGKSTFVKMLLGLVKPDSGRFVVGETVRFGYYSQDGMQFNEQMKVIDAVRKTAEYVDLGGGRKLSAMQFLQHFMFSPQQQQNYIYKLSGGEKRRLYLCTVLMQSPNFLVLDEPTNDLDITSLQILEQYLQDFRGCVIIISHDRYFMDKVVDHLFVFKGNGVVKDFPGNYTQYREWEKLEPEPKKAQNTQNAPSTTRFQGERKRKMSFREKQEFEALGKEIDELENEKKDIEAALSSGSLSTQEIIDLSKRLPVVNDLLDEKSMRWLELSEIE